MANYKIRVNPNFRGELILPTLPYSLKGGQLVTINEKEFKSADIKIAIKKNFLIDETDVESLIDLDITIEENEIATEPNLIEVEEDEDEQEYNQKDIDPRIYETPSNPGVWDPESNSLLDVAAGAKKTIDQLTGVNMDIQTGSHVKFTDKNGSVKKNRPQKKIATSNSLSSRTTTVVRKAQEEVAATAKEVEVAQDNTLPVPDVGDIEMVFEDGPDDIMFVDQEQKKERIQTRNKHVKDIAKATVGKVAKKVAKRRGRPPKNKTADTTVKKVAKKRGRPRKQKPNNEEVG